MVGWCILGGMFFFQNAFVGGVMSKVARDFLTGTVGSCESGGCKMIFLLWVLPPKQRLTWNPKHVALEQVPEV